MYSYNPYYSNYLMHYGNKNSGRYPRGSGDRPYQHDPKKLKKYENKLNRWQTRKERQQQREKENQRQFESATNPITKIGARFNRWLDKRTLLHPIDKGLAPGKVDKMLSKLKESKNINVKVSDINRTYNKPHTTYTYGYNGYLIPVTTFTPIQYKGKKYSLSFKNSKKKNKG